MPQQALYLAVPAAFLLGLGVGPVWQHVNNHLSSASPRALRHEGTDAQILNQIVGGESRSTASNGTLDIKYMSTVAPGNLMPPFLFLQGESDGLEQSFTLNIGGGTGQKIPFVPDESCDDAVFDGASPDLRSPQLPYLKLDSWGCERQPATLAAVILETDELRVTITPQFGGKIWGMYDKVNKKEFFFHNEAHQPANIGARAAWTAGGLEFNWSPGYLGHSAFTEDRVYAAKLATEMGDVVRIYEFDRYNATVFQVDMMLHGGELWTHSKITNPNGGDVSGYWWTCAAHEATPQSRIVAPAEFLTVETYVGAPLRNAPWPEFDNGMLNISFGGLTGERKLDSSYLGNIAYTGDYFLRIQEDERKWIAHVAEDGYVAMHGHPMNGTKFFTWGQSGPGRFMQDFLAGGETGGGYYTELQSGQKPTQQQVFVLPANSSIAFTEYYKALVPDQLPKEYKESASALGKWWSSSAGIPETKVADMERFFAGIEDRQPKEWELISRGSVWGGLHEKLTGRKLSAGTLFQVEQTSESRLWVELAETGFFSNYTLSDTRTPLQYAVDTVWVAALEKSAARRSTWLHDLLLAVAYAEAGEIDRPREMLERSLAVGAVRSPVAARCLAVLTSDAEQAWAYLSMAWDLALEPAPAGEAAEVTQQLQRSVVGDMLLFVLGHLPKWEQGKVDSSSAWFSRLKMTVAGAAAAPLVGTHGLDVLVLAQVILAISDQDHASALKILSENCFPTFGRARDNLVSLWKVAVVGLAEKQAARVLTPAEAHKARKLRPVPRNIGCAYATQYCEEYW
mmetsp:Transcript_10437/g.22914  ORF Transcript_10437/g.22914 Transcript_10437/m.22914 type:complete len:795 (+) Transcript_10437:25-2409(+)